MDNFTVTAIGTVRSGEDGFSIELAPEYRASLAGLEGFSHIQLLWWFSGCDNAASRAKRTEQSPYEGSPEVLGTFATRAPERPNPIALSCAGITYLDAENGFVGLDYIDADHGSPVLDVKPYTPSLDRVESPAVPAWCAGWPSCVEQSGDFDWEAVFRF